jgi:hypothetical protein
MATESLSPDQVMGSAVSRQGLQARRVRSRASLRGVCRRDSDLIVKGRNKSSGK